MNITEGTLLDGRVRYRQFTHGHRSGFEPVLLAAAIPARPGERVLEAGTGAGAALLCLAHRVPALIGIGLELNPDLTALANENFKINGLTSCSAIPGDATVPPALPPFDHIMANPPWHDQAATPSPDAARALAHHATPDLLTAWIAGLSRRLKPRATITLILPAAALSEASAALRAQNLGAITLFPLWPRAGHPAKQFLISARQGAKSPDKLLPGLILHDDTGITPTANQLLRHGGALTL
jgi:tRNA1(Val) A37 N6-methylase TrmN6